VLVRLLYLIMLRVFGRLVLLGRGQASKDAGHHGVASGGGGAAASGRTTEARLG
jgi:hypothetical protein